MIRDTEEIRYLCQFPFESPNYPVSRSLQKQPASQIIRLNRYQKKHYLMGFKSCKLSLEKRRPSKIRSLFMKYLGFIDVIQNTFIQPILYSKYSLSMRFEKCCYLHTFCSSYTLYFCDSTT